MQTFSANGKLLITAEYFVLDGAKALAIPVKFGQTLNVIDNKESSQLVWKSFDPENKSWFDALFYPKTFEAVYSNDVSIEETLKKILTTAEKLRGSKKPLKLAGTTIETQLNFPREWGLGTSSTLVYLIAQLFEVNPYLLNDAAFGGSGYDIACASATSPIIYQRNKALPIVKVVQWQPSFSGHLFFIYLGKKQNSREGIAHYRASKEKNFELIDTISQLTESFLNTTTLPDFDNLIIEHEKLVQSATQLERAKDLYFSDYWGQIKSLGAWGGDFILATSNRTKEETKKYFSDKGFNTFFSFEEMIFEV